MPEAQIYTLSSANKTLFDLFNTPEARTSNKLLDYYDGDQQKYVIECLDGRHGYGKRKDWRERGIAPRHRNITKMIVDKSGLLFQDFPRLSIFRDEEETDSQALQDILYSADAPEFLNNFDVGVRLLKTGIIYCERYVPEGRTTVGGDYKFQKGDALSMQFLHHGVAAVKFDGRNINLLIYSTGPDLEGNPTYRVVYPDMIQDYVYKNGKEILLGEIYNPFGIVTAAPFYDTNKPRTGFWAPMQTDVLSFNEAYNTAMYDTEHAMAHQKQQALFTDCDIESCAPKLYQDPETGMALPQHEKKTSIGGLGNIIKLSGGEPGKTPYVEFKSPNSDLTSLDKIAHDWARDIAYDWDVNLKFEGSGSADSGFKLVVEESNNLNLRQKRAKSFQAGFHRLYSVLRVMYPELPEGELIVDFGKPKLPFNELEVEEIWAMKITEGRASRVDYFMEVKGMTEEEALNKVKEIDEFNESINKNDEEEKDEVV